MYEYCSNCSCDSCTAEKQRLKARADRLEELRAVPVKICVDCKKEIKDDRWRYTDHEGFLCKMCVDDRWEDK